ncbi:hypothetical protein H3H37_11660 [Duganella sp. LX20W]|uniref:DUF2946 domain-containing protein n=1 Tax=Rugamonas brunnea TaxID=2758569 RepID=A0A7W2ESB2_9BURK|nr:hypothetical protein [Rugamonas brunnea]MBA5637712.1 hypothetical protein [Rugamonas brunnea]
MNHVRTMLLWLLLAALPLQGYAAVCTSMAMAGTMAPAQTMAQHQPATAAVQHMTVEHCAMLAKSASDAKFKSCHGHAGADASQSKCGNCAACCVGAAIALPVPALALAESRPAGSEAIPYRLRHVTAHIPAGPERPPHSAPA